ncbi:methionine/alanine import family NSS transporter small subunit [Streptomyces gobiensis]|nr:methionine/alanine import family NSS transporter small subunit [Streptomyces gobiensis]UGY90983.1 methionine/alanine import family NSS transporter small subunit [Streptomyces gobiensis]
MSAGAIVMMIGSIAIVWGGLLAAILKLRTLPDVQQESDSSAE